MTERLKAIENEPWGDDERDTLKPCWTMVEAKSEASEASKDINEARELSGPERASALRLAVASASILVSRVAFFPPPDGPVSGPPPYLAQTWHSKIGIRDECRK